METVMLILGIVAIAISVFAIAISWILYDKSDKLNKEMRDFLIEIRTVTGKMYTDSFGLVKQSYEKFISQGIGEPKGLADDKIVTEIIDNVSNKVEEKFLIELERIKIGENVRDDEVDRLKAELENIIKKIPAQVDRSKKAISNKVENWIYETIKSNPGQKLYDIVQKSAQQGLDSNSVVEIFFEMLAKKKIISTSGQLNQIISTDKFYLPKDC